MYYVFFVPLKCTIANRPPKRIFFELPTHPWRLLRVPICPGAAMCRALQPEQTGRVHGAMGPGAGAEVFTEEAIQEDRSYPEGVSMADPPPSHW